MFEPKNSGALRSHKIDIDHTYFFRTNRYYFIGTVEAIETDGEIPTVKIINPYVVWDTGNFNDFMRSGEPCKGERWNMVQHLNLYQVMDYTEWNFPIPADNMRD